MFVFRKGPGINDENMAKRMKDPFLENVGKFLGVPAAEIQLRQSRSPGNFTVIGPRPPKIKQIPDVQGIDSYCFTFVLKLSDPPRAICDAYIEELNDLKRQLRALIGGGAWLDVIAVIQRIMELESAIESTCRVRERAITYCIFPEDNFVDPFVGGRTLPPKPPIPPL